MQVIQKTYHAFNITNKTNIEKLKATDFPTMNDLYQTICQSLKDNPTNTLNEIKEIINFDFLLVLAFIKAEVKHNRFNETKKEIVIVVDEAHLAIDKDNPTALNFMYQMVKRIRKYHGAMIITTQNLNDFTGTDDIKKKTTAIINNTQYTFIFNLAPHDLIAVADLYRAYGGLSDQEADYIARAGKGEALFIVSGFERHCLQIQASAQEQTGFN